MRYILDHVFCCLDVIEQGMLVYCVFFFRFGYPYILRSDFDLAWALADPINSTLRKLSFIETYYLTPGVVEISEGEFVDVLYQSSGFWLVVSQYGDDTGFLCPDGCIFLPSWVYP